MALSKSVYLHMCVRTRVSGFASGIFCSWVRNLLTWLAGQWVCWYPSLKAACPTPANPHRTPCTPHLIPLTAQTDATHPMPVTSHPTLHARHTSPKTAFPSLHSTPDIPHTAPSTPLSIPLCAMHDVCRFAKSPGCSSNTNLSSL